MTKKQKNLKPKVFFNASVVLSGLRSPNGGSGLLFQWSHKGKISGIISEIVFDEVLRHARKVGISNNILRKELKEFVKIMPEPSKLIAKYEKLVKDHGDIHLFTSSEELKVDYLVSLDKKHVLSLVSKVKVFKIVSPGELIEILKI